MGYVTLESNGKIMMVQARPDKGTPSRAVAKP